MTPLQKPDFQVLQWRCKDGSSSAYAEAKILGAPLQDGFRLYKDLQRTYLGTADLQHTVDDELKMNVVGEEVYSRSDELVSIQLNQAYFL
jgi:hypothetical protein